MEQKRTEEAREHSIAREIGFGLFCAFSVFALFALVSHSPLDPSAFTAGSEDRAPLNWGGAMGAELSSYLFFLFGFASFLLPILLMVFALHAFYFAQRLLILLSSTFALFAILLISCFELAYFVPEFDLGTKLGILELTVPSAGLLGEGSVTFLIRSFGSFGAHLFSFSFFLLSLSLILQRVLLLNFFDRIAALGLSPFLRLKNLLPRRPGFLQFKARVKTPKEKSAYKEPLVRGPDPSVVLENKARLKVQAERLSEFFSQHSIFGSLMSIQRGPVLSTFVFKLDPGVRLARVFSLERDLSLALEVEAANINPLPQLSAIGIELPNAKPEKISLMRLIESEEFLSRPSPLSFSLGLSSLGKASYADLDRLPHLLIAGATGSGKSVGLHALICSLIKKSAPSALRLVLMDPKLLEFQLYSSLAHLLYPVVHHLDEAKVVLDRLIFKMNSRYELLQKAGVRDISGFNAGLKEWPLRKKRELACQEFDPKDQELAYIVLVIDEYAELALMGKKEWEEKIVLLAQKSRASGIHIVLATQRPSVDVITGLIKANFPARLSYRVSAQVDSRTILDHQGAENLLGHGDCYFAQPEWPRPQRYHGAYISIEEVENLVAENSRIVIKR